MKVTETEISGVNIIEPILRDDERGSFIKTFNKDVFEKHNMESSFEESFFSISHKNVIRGMHVQIPPKDGVKLIHVSKGKIIDVVLDIRKKSTTYGKYISIEISDKNRLMIYIPKGCVHGFISLEDNTCVEYLQSTMYAPEYETGIHINSFGMNWDVMNPIISERDQNLPKFTEFETPFT